jgi:CheY-like chemotaxis protein
VPSVLIVDDDRALRKLLRAYLEQESVSVIEAESGEEALALIDKIAPTLVLLDLRLPGMDGFDVLRRLEASGQTVPVILAAVGGRRLELPSASTIAARARAPRACPEPWQATRRHGRESTCSSNTAMRSRARPGARAASRALGRRSSRRR